MHNTTPPRIMTLAEVDALADCQSEEWEQFQIDQDHARADLDRAALEVVAEDAYDEMRYLVAIQANRKDGTSGTRQ